MSDTVYVTRNGHSRAHAKELSGKKMAVLCSADGFLAELARA